MKKTVSLFLALLLLLSLVCCGTPQQTETTLPPTTETSVIDVVPQIWVPNFVGKSFDALGASDNYTVVEKERVPSDQPAGTILAQEPEKGTFADIGCTVYVTVSQGDGTEEPTLPEQTDPPSQLATTRPTQPEQPSNAGSDLPEQTDPEIPPQEEHPTNPPTSPPTNPPTNPPTTEAPTTQPPQTAPQLDRNGSYTSKDDVALYLHLYGRLPNNFITKKQAEDRYGWDGGSLSRYGMCIGGDRFYNNDGRLPGGYTYYECDIDTLYSSKRGSKRLVFTYSGIIYYTSDHYKTFTRLY